MLMGLWIGMALSQALAESPEASVPNESRLERNESAALPGITLAELEDLAQRTNPTLNQAAARVEAARGRFVQVGLYPNPVAGYMGSEIGNSGLAGQQGGFVSQEVVTAGKLQLSREVAAQEVQQAQWAWDTQSQRVLTDVRRGFYEALVAQRSLELTEHLAQVGDEGVKTVDALIKAKEKARGDLLQAKIEADTAKILLERARNRHAAVWRSLSAVVGTDVEPQPLAGDLHDDLPQLTWDDTFARLLERSPQLAGAQSGVARAQAALNREFAGRLPNVDLLAAVQHDASTEDTFASLQVGVPIPLYNRNQGNIRTAQAELIAAMNEVQRIQLALNQRLAAVFEQYTNARFQVEKYQRDIVPNAEESLKLTTSGYKQGEFNYVSLLTAQRTFFQTNLAYLDALRELRAAATLIEGDLLSDSLQAGESSDREAPPGAVSVPGASLGSILERAAELR
jgi:cobalt-zinc-cadmium efflux system outer membrane protein